MKYIPFILSIMIMACDLERIDDGTGLCNNPSLYEFESSFTAGIQDSAIAVIKTSTGNYVMTGNTHTQGSKLLVYETNLCQENLLHLGLGDNTNDHVGKGLLKTANGDLIVAGTQYFSFLPNKAYVARINQANVISDIWNESLDKGLQCNDIIPASNGAYLLGCSIFEEESFGDANNGYIIGLDQNLDLLFGIQFMTSFESEIYKVVESGSGQYFGIGSVWIGFGQRIFFVATNPAGANLLQQTLTFNNISGDNNVYGITGVSTSDGNIVISGYYGLLGGSLITYLKKVNTQGETIWEFEYSNSLMETIGNHTPAAVIQTTDGGYLVAGTHKINTGNSDIFLLKVNPNGIYHWDKSHGGPMNDVAHDVLQETDGGFVIVGFTDSFNALGESGRLYFVKTDMAGDIN